MKAHLSAHKGAYITGGCTVAAALAAGYFLFKGGKGNGPNKQLFLEDYAGMPGASFGLNEALTEGLNRAVDYELKLWLDPNSNSFLGVADILFEFNKESKQDIFLSAQGLSIQGIKFNGVKVNQNVYDEILERKQGFLYINPSHINKDPFKLTILYKAEYGSDCGLLKHHDPESKEGDMYFFSSNKILGTERIYPFFESFHVRNLFRLSLTVPKGWKAISNEKSDSPVEVNNDFDEFEDQDIPSKDEFSTFNFRQTKSIPFNALNIAAGNLKEIPTKSSFTGRKINVFALNTEADKVKKFSEVIGKVTKHTLQRMEKLTGFKYPFSKCELLILPEELNFSYIFGSNPQNVNKEYPGLISLFMRDFHNFKTDFIFDLVHSIVKLWLGVLVTPEWWSETWFTESFAKFLAYKIFREDAKTLGFSEDELKNWQFLTKTSGLYYQIMNDSSGANAPLRLHSILHSSDLKYYAHSKFQKVGMFMIQELFSFYEPETFETFLKLLVQNCAFKSIGYQNFKLGFESVIAGLRDDAEVNFKNCFEYPCVDEISFTNQNDKLIVKQNIRENAACSNSKKHKVEIKFLSISGEVLKTEIIEIGKDSVKLDFPEETYTFLSVMKLHSFYYELYEGEELEKLIHIIENNDEIDGKLKLKIARIIFVNIFKSNSFTLEQGLRGLKILLETSSAEDQKWILRGFSLVAKHVDYSEESSKCLVDFCETIVKLADKNHALVPYLSYFGVHDHKTVEIVSNFVKEFNYEESYDPKSSLLNYDLLKSSIQMIVHLRVDLEKAKTFSELVGKSYAPLGAQLNMVIDAYTQSLLSPSSPPLSTLSSLFSSPPSHRQALSFYFNRLHLEQDQSEPMVEVREQLRKVKSQSHKTHSLAFYNICKMLARADRKQQSLGKEEGLSEEGSVQGYCKDMEPKRLFENRVFVKYTLK